MRTLLIALLLALTAGCATSPRLVELQGFDQRITVQKAVDPIAFAGLPTSGEWGQYYHTGQVFGVVVEFPTGEKEEGLESEFDSLLPFYDGYAVRKDGREFPVRAQFIQNGCKLSMLFIVGGTKSPAGMKGVVASTLSDRLFRLQKESDTLSARIVEFQPENLKSGEYRRSFVQRYGTPLDGFEFVSAQKLAQLFAGWREIKGADHVGTFLIPPWLSYDVVNSVATLNPRYSFSEKFAGTASLTIIPSVIGTVIGGVADAVRAGNVPSRGRDMHSIPGERTEASKRVLDALKAQCSPQTISRR